MPRTLPKVTDYADYRRFLQDHYDFRKRQDPAFSYGAFAKRAGVARSHLKGVINGENLSPASVRSYARGLGLDERESEYFALLVQANQAKGPAAKRTATGALRRWLHEWQTVTLPEEAVLGLFRRWSRYVVFASTKLPDFRADPAWIRRRLRERVSVAEAAEALEFLRRHGFIRTRGKRLLSTLTGRLESFGNSPELDRLLQGNAQDLYREALSTFPRPPQHDECIMAAALTPSEVRALEGKFRQWVREVLPSPRSKRTGSNLYCLLWDPVLLSTLEK